MLQRTPKAKSGLSDCKRRVKRLRKARVSMPKIESYATAIIERIEQQEHGGWPTQAGFWLEWATSTAGRCSENELVPMA
jgi:hypothetical protein